MESKLKCLFCGRFLMETKDWFKCENNHHSDWLELKKGCGYKIPKRVSNYEFSREDIENLQNEKLIHIKTENKKGEVDLIVFVQGTVDDNDPYAPYYITLESLKANEKPFWPYKHRSFEIIEGTGRSLKSGKEIKTIN